MTFDKIVAPTPRELFIGQIIKKVLSGELRVGEKLPTERELAEQMEINRSAVHSALEELQRMGFVSMEPRRGNYIADYANDGDFYTLEAIARYSRHGLDRGLRVDMVELRNAIVGAAMIRITKFGTGVEVQALKELVKRHRDEFETAKDVESSAARMLEFNTEMVHLSGNRLSRLLMNTLGPKSTQIWEACVSFWGTESEMEQEEKIVAMLEEGKGHDAALYIEKQFDVTAEEKNLRA